MKNIKLFMLIAAAAVFAACSETDINTNPVEVGFEKNIISFNESDGMVKIPLKVNGEQNGLVRVVVKATDGTAESEKHYILTSGDINIPAGEQVSLELRILDDGQEENADREFTLTVESAEGAELSILHECKVIIKDVDAVPFFKLFGTYTCEAIDYATETPVTFQVTIDDEGEGTQEYLYGNGMPSSWYGFDTKMIFGFNEDGTLTFEYGYWDGLYNFGSFYAAITYQPMQLAGSSLSPVASTEATYNDSYDTITFAEGTYATTGVYLYDGGIQGYKGYYDAPVQLVKMTKVVDE